MKGAAAACWIGRQPAALSSYACTHTYTICTHVRVDKSMCLFRGLVSRYNNMYRDIYAIYMYV